jgi:hypothetical protein
MSTQDQVTAIISAAIDGAIESYREMEQMATAFRALSPVVMTLADQGIHPELIAGQLRVIADSLLGIED